MKIKNLILITALFFLSGTFKGQSNNNWIPVLISADGTNGNAGVEASYMLAKCNASDVVFIKLTNNNQYPFCKYLSIPFTQNIKFYENTLQTFKNNDKDNDKDKLSLLNKSLITQVSGCQLLPSSF